MKNIIYLLGLTVFIGIFGCTPKNDGVVDIHDTQNIRRDGKLPFMKPPLYMAYNDSSHYKVPDFSFVDQDSNVITRETFKDKIYITDFFFTSCPSICPKMKKQMLRLYEKFEKNDNIVFLSHSIDTRHDTVATLKRFATNMDVQTDKWHLVTGDWEEIKRMAEAYITVVPFEDDEVPGGYEHSGHFVLVDGNHHIRSVCNGTDEESVDRLMGDIEILLKE